jgi:hypothetical protein
MPIVAAKLKAELELRVYNGLKQAFAADGKDNAEADASWQKTAKAISGIAEDICNMLLLEVQVAPGIAVTTAGSPAAQAGSTVAPGKLL